MEVPHRHLDACAEERIRVIDVPDRSAAKPGAGAVAWIPRARIGRPAIPTVPSRKRLIPLAAVAQRVGRVLQPVGDDVASPSRRARPWQATMPVDSSSRRCAANRSCQRIRLTTPVSSSTVMNIIPSAEPGFCRTQHDVGHNPAHRPGPMAGRHGRPSFVLAASPAGRPLDAASGSARCCGGRRSPRARPLSASASPSIPPASAGPTGASAAANSGGTVSASPGNAARGTGILRNRLYVGELLWNRMRFIRDPSTGRPMSRMNPQ